ncbi:lysophospholipase L1-like esterase domain protein [Mycobacterium xenopi 4042]|uniref:Lysophospholipase L1-like esterase domain protein n=1 Tax=Mycobacterium xenopi 4042 TaxID=1299334 RepID=X8AEB4_MYCXE|nr:lysophospholipase L1-like esterase domain protein [Mycobacterium xenopi 4042]
MDIRAPRRSLIALAAAGALASTGTAYLGARNLLIGQARQARSVIPKAWDPRHALTACTPPAAGLSSGGIVACSSTYT